MEFHKNIEENLPKRYFEGKGNDFIRYYFVKPNYDKSDCSVSVFLIVTVITIIIIIIITIIIM
jgi:hypothetical protein